MNCKEVTDLVDAYLDGELDPVTNNNIEAHLRECSRCEQAFRDHHALISAIGTAAPYHKSPQTLRERLQASLRSEIPDSAHDIQPQNREKNIRKRRRSAPPFFEWPWNWLGVAAALLLAVLIVWRLAPAWPWNGQQFLATELVSSHVRSLMVDHLTDVASSDQHTVKPWFDGKLDFAPNVVNPAADGFPLVGGRLDYLDGRPVAALVYQRRKHFINVFVWPAESRKLRPAQAMSRQGYQLLHWVDRDLNYWAVSDTSANDLVLLRELLEKENAPSP